MTNDRIIAKAIGQWREQHPDYVPASGTVIASERDPLAYEVGHCENGRAYCFYVKDGQRVEKAFPIQDIFDVNEVKKIATRSMLRGAMGDMNN